MLRRHFPALWAARQRRYESRTADSWRIPCGFESRQAARAPKLAGTNQSGRAANAGVRELRDSRVSAQREVARQLWRGREALRVLSRVDRAGLQEGAEGLRHERERDDSVFGGQAAAGRARAHDRESADRAADKNHLAAPARRSLALPAILGNGRRRASSPRGVVSPPRGEVRAPSF